MNMPADEKARLDSLHRSGILDTSVIDTRFHRLTRICCQLFNAKMSVISLLDDTHQWFKSAHGLTLSGTPRTHAFCRYAVETGMPLIVEDTSLDERFRDNPMVVGYPGVRFYAGFPVRLPDGQIAGALCVMDDSPRFFTDDECLLLGDVAQIVEDEFRIIELITIDALTGVCNRRGFTLIAGNMLKKCGKRDTPASAIFFDLDDFKTINDQFGHAEGDLVLRQFAELLEDAMPDHAVIARQGGDEFVALLTGEKALHAEEVVAQLTHRVAEINRTSGKLYQIQFSAGVAVFDPQRHHSIDDLFNESDSLMYHCKAMHKREG